MDEPHLSTTMLALIEQLAAIGFLQCPHLPHAEHIDQVAILETAAQMSESNEIMPVVNETGHWIRTALLEPCLFPLLSKGSVNVFQPTINM